MREKLQILMNSENLTGSKLAEYLGIQPSSISHILGGRNKPSLDFVQKILQRYPRINPDWLLLDSDEMYRPNSAVVASSEATQLPFTDNDETPDTIAPAENSTITSTATQPANSTNTNSEADLLMGAMAATNRGNVKRVIVLFDDHTFESYELKR